mgnify:CR=1 FL=1
MPLEPGHHRDHALVQGFHDALVVHLHDFGLGVHAVRLDAGLTAREAHGLVAARLDGHRQQRHGHLLARGQQTVHLARRRVVVERGGEAYELVGGLAHGGHTATTWCPACFFAMSFFATIWMRSGEATDVPPNLHTISDMVLFLVMLNPIGCPLYQTVASSPIESPLTGAFYMGKTKRTSSRPHDALETEQIMRATSRTEDSFDVALHTPYPAW